MVTIRKFFWLKPFFVSQHFQYENVMNYFQRVISNYENGVAKIFLLSKFRFLSIAAKFMPKVLLENPSKTFLFNNINKVY